MLETMTELSSITYLNKCLCCGGENLTTVLDLIDQPLANSYVQEQSDTEVFYPLALNYCNDCTHLQLTHAVHPDLLFKNYLYVSGTTQTLRDYFDQFVHTVTSHMPVKGPYKVLDIACNDGSQLDAFKKYGHQTYGIDPAENLHQLSSLNHTVICDYFNESAVASLGADRYDVIIAQNVFAHNTYPDEFLRICEDRLSNTGRLFIQTSQADMVEYGQFDTIYHEHISFFNTRSMGTLANRSGMYLESVFKTDIHGTSYVFVLSKDPACDNTQLLIDKEAKQTIDVVKKFVDNAISVVTALKDELNKYPGALIVGYGAAAKGNTLLNFGEIDLDYIVDDNPLKQGLYTPGRKIKIVSLDEMISVAKGRSVVWLPLSWNFFKEIKHRIKDKYHEPTVFIKYFPKIQVTLDSDE
jgi:2-polyprenyl-3-methyl-5-hydroxy-6-metoxy-1,4-benzoquinol methylase